MDYRIQSPQYTQEQGKFAAAAAQQVQYPNAFARQRLLKLVGV